MLFNHVDDSLGHCDLKSCLPPPYTVERMKPRLFFNDELDLLALVQRTQRLLLTNPRR
jgi:hypothetical protein